MKHPGYFMRLVVAGSRGVGGAPMPLGQIDLGEDEPELRLFLEHYRAAPRDLTVEQTRMWGALCLYCLARCLAANRPCPLAASSFLPVQIDSMRKSVDAWRLKEVAGANDAAALVDRLRVREEPAQADAESVIEVEWLPPEGENHRLRMRLDQRIEWDQEQPVVVSFVAPECPSVNLGFADGTAAVASRGQIGVLVSDDWEGVALHLPRIGARAVQRLKVVGLKGWAGRQYFDIPTESQPTENRQDLRPPWVASIDGTATQLVFLQLEKHGAITEEEAVSILGSPRAFRRFSLEFEEHLTKLPFKVRIETAKGGKRYVREEVR